LLGHILERAENSTHIGCRAAVHLTDTEIGAHRVDDHEHYVADLLDLGAQELQVGDEAKHLLYAAHTSAVDEKDALEIGSGGDQARQAGIARVVFGVEPDDLALWRGAFAAR